MLSFFKKAGDFIRHPTHSRTMGIVVILVLVSAVSLTVIAAQQQQQIRQRAIGNECASDYSSCDSEYGTCIRENCDALAAPSAVPNRADYSTDEEYDIAYNKFKTDYDAYTINYGNCTKTCRTTHETCKQNVFNASSECLKNSAPAPTPTPTPIPLPPTLKLSIAPFQPVAEKEITITIETTFPSGNLTPPARIQIWVGGQWNNNWNDVDKSNCSSTGKVIYSCAVKVSEKEGGNKRYLGRISFNANDSSWTEAEIIVNVGAAATTPIPVAVPPADLKITLTAVSLCGGQGSLTGGPQITLTLDINSENQQAPFTYQILRTVDQYKETKALVTLTYPKDRSYVDTAITYQHAYKYTVIVPAAPNLPPFESNSSYSSFCPALNGAGGTAGQQAAVPIAASTPSPTPSPTPTPIPINNVLLALALNTQDIPTLSPAPTASITPTDSITPTVTVAPAVSDNLSVNLALYNLTTNELINGALAAPVSFAKTPIPKRQYSAQVSPNNLQINKYYLVARTNNNMIAKTAFAVTTANQTITVPTTTLVFGDITKDRDISALDWNALRNCWGKSTKDNPSCTAADFDQSGEVNQIDFNILMRGWATWNEEGKIVNL